MVNGLGGNFRTGPDVLRASLRTVIFAAPQTFIGGQVFRTYAGSDSRKLARLDNDVGSTPCRLRA
jgi:hypothetical protein